MSALFCFEGVTVERNGVHALVDFDATLPDGGVTAVSGPSGSGKSTLLRLCNRLEVPTTGRVLFEGDDVTTLDPLQLRRRVGMCFQRPTPFPGSVADNLAVADPAATSTQMADVLSCVGLTGDWLERDATALSGGEAQRMCLARMLLTHPRVLLLDEPTASVDAAAAQVIEQTVRRLANEGMNVLWVSHDPAQIQRIADRVLRVEHGRSLGIEVVAP